MHIKSNDIVEIFLGGTLEELGQLASALDLFCKQYGLDDLTKNQINLILEELYTNTANYGFKDIKNGRVKIRLTIADGQLEIFYQDNGVAFNPLEKDNPDTLLSVDDRAIGGLGIFLVKTLTNHLAYSRVDQYNQITMKKTLPLKRN
jgi:anti-sigma regulatory factor (Ser/Thr protein kinase)